MNSSSTSSVTLESPWLGLRSFAESDAAHFFGRELELEDLRDRVVHKPLTVLFGQSGWGKTSLLQAGLIPQLRKEGFLPVIIRLVHDDGADSLERQVIDALAKALASSGSPMSKETINALVDRGTSLWLLLHDPVYGLTDTGVGTPVPVFIFDQFEEVFTLGERPERRSYSLAFRDALASLVENRPTADVRERIANDGALADRINYQARNYRVLLALRYDFLHLLERWRKQMPAVMENRMELRLLGGPQALQAVVRPGQMRPGKPAIIDDEVGRNIVRFVAGVDASLPLLEIDAVPPLLSLVCAELNAVRIEQGGEQVSYSQFEGGSAEILNSFYDRSFDVMTFGTKLESVPQAAETLSALRVLVEDRLLSADGYRESISFDTVIWELSGKADVSTAKHVLSSLIERRLLSVDERGGVQRLELTHDVLTRIAKASRDARTEKEAVERAKAEQERAETRTRKAVAERNRLRKLAIVAAVCAVIAAAGAAFGILGMVHSKQAAEEAAKGFGAARTATDGFLSRIAGADLAYIPGIQELREEMADKAIAQYRAMLEGRPQDDDLKLALAKAHKARAEILAQIGSVQEASTALTDSVNELSGMLRDRETDEIRLMFAEAQFSLANFQYEVGDERGKETAKAALTAAAPVLNKGKHAIAATISAKACNALGNMEDDRLAKIRWFSQGRSFVLENLEAAEGDSQGTIDLMLCLANTSWNLRKQMFQGESPADKSKGEELRLQALKADEELRQLQPNSPVQQRNKAITFEWLAEELEETGRTVEARQSYEEALKLYRAASENNPSVVKYHGALILSLKGYGEFLTRLGDHATARSSYLEAVGMADKVVGIRAERPADAENLLWTYYLLARFQQGKNATTAGKTRADGIETGRPLIGRHPESIGLTNAYCELLAQQALFEPVLSSPKEAAELLREAMALLDARKSRQQGSPSSVDAANYLKWSEGLDNALALLATANPDSSAAISSERSRLLEKALEWFPSTQDNEAKQSLLSLASKNANLFYLAGEAAKAAELHRQMIDYAEPSLKAKPFDWYLRSAISKQYSGLAKACEKLGSLDEEFAARRKSIEIGYKRDFGVGVFDNVLRPDASPTPELMQKLRTVDEWKPKVKWFTVPCNFDGITFNFSVYISGGVPAPGFDPLADQARYLLEFRSGKIPESVRESFRRLARIATENNVDFVDLCNYALATPSSNEVPNSATTKLAAAQTATGVKAALAKAEPGDVTKQIDFALSLESLGDAYLDAKIPSKAEEMYFEALAIREKIVAADGADRKFKRELANVHWKLAKFYAASKQREKMFRHYQDELKLSRELAESDPRDSKSQGSLAETFEMLRNEYLETKDTTLKEALEAGVAAIAAREAELALLPGDPDITRKLANTLHIQGITLCGDRGGLAKSLPFLDRAAKLYAELKSAGKLDQKYFQLGDVIGIWSLQANEVMAAKQALDTNDINTTARLGKAILQLSSGTSLLNADIVEYGFNLLKSLPDGRPDTAEIQTLLFKKMRETGRHEEALRPLAKLLMIDPTNLYALDQQADIHFDAKRFSEAAKSYERILALVRSDAETNPTESTIKETLRAWLNLGTCQMNTATPTAAERPLTDALEWCIDRDRRSVLGDVTADDEEVECRKKLVGLYSSVLREPKKALPHQKIICAIQDRRLKMGQNFASNVSDEAALGLSQLALIHEYSNEGKEAVSVYKSALALRRSMFASTPSDRNFEQCMAVANLLVDSASEAGNLDDSLQYGREALEFCDRVKVGQVEAGLLRAYRIKLHARLSSVLKDLQRYEEALAESQVKLNLAREGFESYPEGSPDRETAKNDLVSAYGGHTWNLLLARKFDLVLKTAKESFELEQKIWVEGNLAHALLFSGHRDEALAIYRKNRGKRLEINDGQTWEEAVKDDFTKFRTAGLDHGDFAEVERELGLGTTIDVFNSN